MAIHTDDPRLTDAIAAFDQTNWAQLILDAQMNLVWVSDELKKFLGEHDDDRLGCGRSILEAFSREVWVETIAPESVVRMANDFGGFILAVRPEAASEARGPVADIIRNLEPQPPSFASYSSFMYVRDQPEPYQVDVVGIVLRDEAGEFVGAWVGMFSALPPTLMQLLARGDIDMYQRMARLIEPRRRRAAILFADVQASGALARSLPTETYFGLVRNLTSDMDAIVARNRGITGKHAGDGLTAFFLADDLGSASAAAAAALETAFSMRECAAKIFGSLAERLGASEVLEGALNVGVHWGANLYMGQLVPGSRLDVTSLGDEMNECARVQETARDGGILATKGVIEQLEPEDAERLDLDPPSMLYRPLGEFESASDKARRDAAGLAVTLL